MIDLLCHAGDSTINILVGIEPKLKDYFNHFIVLYCVISFSTKLNCLQPVVSNVCELEIHIRVKNGC